MSIPPEILELIERFDNNREAYMSGQYKETQLRREFIDPFFEVLGWDVSNKGGYAEAYKDVIHEDSLKIGGHTKAPDYCFRIGGTRKFFLEAKKPSVNIKGDISSAYQLRRYAWSAKLPLSILSDFEEFAVYDCRIKPQKNDKSSTARTIYMKYTEYPDRWDEIASVFSQKAVLKGSFDKYVDSSKRKKGTAEVDTAFLKEIEQWREKLALNLAIRNPGLSQRELNFAVQRTIDRIIFLRICEDRGMEEYGRFMALQNGNNVYKRMCQLFSQADNKYNSGLFHFQTEKDRPEEPDRLTLDLKIDDDVLKGILKGLYYPDSPYEFAVLPSDILGQVYEQFLGKVIRLTKGHRAKVEDKPEVKKAGGVYYTPTYIVDYIVKNTVGKLLEGRGDRPVALSIKQASKLKILDPACGSGSFLIGAYQYLLDWHRDKYLEASRGTLHVPKKEKAGIINKGHVQRAPTRRRDVPLYQGQGGEWKLTTAERKRILLNNIYGVDIDPQAVEVTKLSLLLKVLEGETEETINRQLKLLHERALPDLGNNIKCGNSLIGPDFYNNKQMSMLDDEEQYRINVFDWDAEFKDIMKDGGFDAVIGNPPYIRIQALKEWAPIEVEHYKKRYVSASKGNYDIYVVFVEKGLSLLNPSGKLGFILPHKFFNAHYGKPLRGVLSIGNHLSQVVHFGDQQVFNGATTYTCLFFLSKKGEKEIKVSKVFDLDGWKTSGEATRGEIQANRLNDDEWKMVIGDSALLFDKLQKNPTKLEDVTIRIFQGIKTSADKIYIVKEVERKGKNVKIYSREKERYYWLESALLHPLIKGGDSKRYSLTKTDRLVLFPYIKQCMGKTELILESDFKVRYPLSWEYLIDNKKYLESRENGKVFGPKWYGYIYPKALDVMHLPKIFTPDIALHSSFSLDETGELYFTGGVAGGYGILVSKEYVCEYILGLLNSKVLEWYIRQTATQMRGGYYSFEARFIRHLPVPRFNFDNPSDKARHDQMVSLVEQMLELNKKLMAAKTGDEKSRLHRLIDATDRQIDQLVYELYDLTDEEIKIVEGE